MPKTGKMARSYSFQEGILYVLLFGTPFIFHPLIEDNFRAPKTAFAIICIIAFTTIGFIRALINNHRIFESKPVTAPLVVTGFLVLISCFVAPGTDLALRAGFNVAWYGLFALALWDWSKNRAPIISIEDILILTAVISSVYAIFQYYGYDPFFSARRSEYVGRWIACAFIGQPTLLALYLGAIFPLMLSKMTSSRLLWPRFLYLAALILTAGAILCTHSRATLAGVTIIILLWLAGAVTLLRKHKLNVKLIVLSIILMVTLSSIFLANNPQYMKRIKEGITFSGTSSSRLFYWRVIVDMVKESPLTGVGLGNFQALNFDYSVRLVQDSRTNLKPDSRYIIQQAHNEYLQVVSELGLPGMIILLWVIVLVILNGVGFIISSYQANFPSEVQFLQKLGYLCGFVFICLNALLNFPLHLAPSATLFVVYGIFVLRD